MNSDLKKHPLDHLRDRPELEEDVTAVDFDNMAVINAKVSNVSKRGCRLTSVDIRRLYKNVGIWSADANKMVKVSIISIKGLDATAVFPKTQSAFSDKRREKRNNVSMPVKIESLDGTLSMDGRIVDAGNNGVQISGKGLPGLPSEVLLTMRMFSKPVVAEFAWRNEKAAGLRLLWDRTLEQAVGTEQTEETEDTPAETADS